MDTFWIGYCQLMDTLWVTIGYPLDSFWTVQSKNLCMLNRVFKIRIKYKLAQK